VFSYQILVTTIDKHVGGQFSRVAHRETFQESRKCKQFHEHEEVPDYHYKVENLIDSISGMSR